VRDNNQSTSETQGLFSQTSQSTDTIGLNTYLLAILEESWYHSGMANGKEQHKIALSIPRETWEAVNKLAGEHQRSFTKELVWALQEYVRRERERER
jgi:hypothetical protein